MEFGITLFTFLNNVYSRYEDSESLYILFETYAVWSRSTIKAYENELKIVCNQIVEDSEIGEVDEDSEHHTNRVIIDKLCTVRYLIFDEFAIECSFPNVF
jgi:hypothetical protein